MEIELGEGPEGGPKSRGRTLALALAGAALSIGLLEVLAAMLTAVVNPLLSEPIPRRAELFEGHARGLSFLIGDSEGREGIHPVLGWQYRSDFAMGLDTLNSRGLRASREYSSSPSDGTLRIAAFGDSFVYCIGVSNPDCWTSIMEEDQKIEVLNYGVGGYGSDQAFLRYLDEGRELAPEIVLIGFAPVDLRRIVNRYRRFMSSDEGPWFKPRFVMRDDTLSVVPVPVSSRADAQRLLAEPGRVTEIGDLDHWYEPALYEHELYRWSPMYRLSSNLWIRLKRRYFHPDRLFEDGLFRTQSEAFTVQTAVLQAFVDSVTAHGAQPVILVLPSRTDLEQDAAGHLPEYDPLRRELERRGMEIVDPLEGFLSSAVPIEDFFLPDGHYSLKGNRVIAREVANFLRIN